MISTIYSKCFRKHQKVKRNLISSLAMTAKLEEELIGRIKDVIDPGTQKSIQTIGILQRVQVNIEREANVTLDFVVPGYPFKSQIIDQIHRNIDDIQWLKDIKISLTPPHKSVTINENQALSKICHIIAVSSCKGGVGKSTVAANLAIAMSDKDLKVGILDADIYGPSLPLLLPASDPVVHRSKLNPKHILPLTSMYRPNLKGGKTAAIVRGPIVSKIINQLLLSTEWGELDYLIIDMPPGTGDIQITLSQSANLSGAVVVTTPHKLSLIDAAKGASMFEDLKVPLLAVIENMSYFVCDIGKIYYPFGKGGRDNLLKGWKQLNKNVINQPSLSVISHHNDLISCPFHSLPFERFEEKDLTNDKNDRTNEVVSVVTQNDHSIIPEMIRKNCSVSVDVYNALTNDIILEIFKSQINALLIPSITYSSSREVLILRYFTPNQAIELTIPKSELRIRDPKTGSRLADVGSENEFKDIIPIKFDFKGHYGVAINWSDGYYADIFPYDILKLIAEEYK